MLKKLIMVALVSSILIKPSFCMEEEDDDDSYIMRQFEMNEDGSYLTPDALLMEALRQSNSKEARYWLNEGANANYKSNGETPLLALCHKKYQQDESQALEFLKLLIEKGAILDDTDDEGVTPLMLALVHNNIQIARYLIDLGANINAITNDGYPCLFCVRDQNLCEYFLKAGIDFNIRSPDGQTYSMVIAENGTLDLVKFILEKDAKISRKDYSGHGIIDYAELNENKEVAEFVTAKLNQFNRSKRSRDYDKKSAIATKRLRKETEPAARMEDDTCTVMGSVDFDKYVHAKHCSFDSAQKICPVLGFNPRIRIHNPTGELGARCFINSVFQCLFHLPNFTRLVINQSNNYQEQSLAKLYAKILKNTVSFYHNQIINYSNFCVKIWNSLGYEPGTHQDASEFLNYLLDGVLDEDLSEELKAKLPCYEPTGIPITDLSKLFYSTVQSKITSMGNLVSTNRDYYTMLNLPLSTGNLSLEDCLKSYFAQEQIEQTNPDEPAKEKQFSLIQPAPYMVIRLKRDNFTIDNSNGERKYIITKNNAAITFPLDLTLVHKDNDSGEETESQYKLLSFIVHVGTTQIGHYSAFININNEWYYFNDAHQPVKMNQKQIYDIGCRGYYAEPEVNPAIFFYGKT